MSAISNFLQGLVDVDYYSYPGFFKKQKHSKCLDIDVDIEYLHHVRESVPRKYDLDNINI
jgi:hypothetical protein